MFLARYIERAGTGTLDMVSLSRAAGLREPEFRFEHGQFIQVLWRPVAVPPEVTPEVKRLIQILDRDLSRGEMMALLGLKDEKHFREKYQQPSVRRGVIMMTIPEKPNSRLQRYRLTPAGHALRLRLISEASSSAR